MTIRRGSAAVTLLTALVLTGLTVPTGPPGDAFERGDVRFWDGYSLDSGSIDDVYGVDTYLHRTYAVGQTFGSFGTPNKGITDFFLSVTVQRAATVTRLGYW